MILLEAWDKIIKEKHVLIGQGHFQWHDMTTTLEEIERATEKRIEEQFTLRSVQVVVTLFKETTLQVFSGAVVS